MKKILFSVTFLMTLYSCTSWEEELIKKRTPYLGKEFRIDGCYYKQYSDSSFGYRFFYSNGVSLAFIDSSDITTNEQSKPKSKKHWSIFKVKENTITETYWEEANLFQIGLYDRYYKIINDTTLQFMDENNSSFFHFKQYSPKPDSTNVYIK